MNKIFTISLSLLIASIGYAQNTPTTAASSPTKAAADVISLFSNSYTNVPIDTWRTSWSAATLTDTTIAGNDVKRYSGLDFVGIEMISKRLNINSMDSFEFDLWTPNSTTFKFKLVDFGADTSYGGGDDKEHELSITPTLNGWNHISVPISAFTGLTTKANIAQLIFASVPSGTSVVYIDNVMFSKNTVVAAPTVAAAAPTKPASDVISLFSNSYTNVPIDTWRTSWSAATLTETQIASNDVKKYSGLDFVGIEMITKRLNINSMDSFEFDLWTPNSTTFKFKLVDFGADTSYGGGDDKEHELSITPTLNGWNHISVPISAFTGLTTKANIAQLIFASVPSGSSIVYIDNVMFSKNTVVAAPTVAAAAPTKPASDVISLFSNSYTNVPIDTWRTSWSAATLTEIQIASNDVKKYSGLDYVGIEMITKRLNINSMDSFEFDLWTPNSTTFKFKLVDFGADTSFGGGDDKEHELSITPTLNGWNHISVPISAFTGLTTKANIAQLIFASVPSGSSIVYIDNVLFSKNMQTSLSSAYPERVGIYPNPVKNILNINAKNTIQHVVIYNSLGQVVSNSTPETLDLVMQLTDLPNGVYFVQVTVNGVDTFSKISKE